MIRRPPRSTLFPTRRSSDLFPQRRRMDLCNRKSRVGFVYARAHLRTSRDRKSTRLNSSHSQISYAVFCLKKKKETTPTVTPMRCHHPLTPRTPAAEPPRGRG